MQILIYPADRILVCFLSYKCWIKRLFFIMWIVQRAFVIQKKNVHLSSWPECGLSLKSRSSIAKQTPGSRNNIRFVFALSKNLTKSEIEIEVIIHGNVRGITERSAFVSMRTHNRTRNSICESISERKRLNADYPFGSTQANTHTHTVRQQKDKRKFLNQRNQRLHDFTKSKAAKQKKIYSKLPRQDYAFTQKKPCQCCHNCHQIPHFPSQTVFNSHQDYKNSPLANKTFFTYVPPPYERTCIENRFLCVCFLLYP